MKNRKDKPRWYPKKPQNQYHDYYCDPDECSFAIQTRKVCKGNPHNCKSQQYKRLANLKDRFKPNPTSQVIVALEESYRKKKGGRDMKQC